MECPKCHGIIDDNSAMCPHCHKVFLLECPNCHELGESPVCENCGYTILVKCSKCSKINPSTNNLCTKCSFPVNTSLAYQECESDEFASVIIKFSNLGKIKKLLKSKNLYEKFFYKLKNLLIANTKSIDGKLITYGDVFVLNFNKELSLPTSANKAIRFSLKLANAFSELNNNVFEELRAPLGLNITIIKKRAEELQTVNDYKNNVKMLTVNKNVKKYLKGMQVILDENIWECINKDYKTDSLYNMEENGKSLMFYEILLSNYVLPPREEDIVESTKTVQHKIKYENKISENNDLYTFKVLDINAKCKFENIPTSATASAITELDFNKTKILSLRAKQNFMPDTAEIYEVCRNKGFSIIPVTCTQELNYKPWGFFESIFRTYFGLPSQRKLSKLNNIDEAYLKAFKPLFDLCNETSVKSMSPEDARYTYMELWGKFLSILKNTVILVDGFENLDDTSIQTLELYFDIFKNIKPNFIFITNQECSVHSKIKGLLRTPCYTEFSLRASDLNNCLEIIKSDAKDFLESFYYEKIRENYDGSYMYFKYAIEYLKETGVLIDFENKLIVKDSKSVVLAKDLNGIFKSRMKHFGKDISISFIMAYALMLSPNLDTDILKVLGTENLDNNIQKLIDNKLATFENNILCLNNFNLYKPVIETSLKKEAEAFLAKNILAKIGKDLNCTTMALLFGRLGNFKEEYLTLWKNSRFVMLTGDYDAYLKNCLGYLSLVEHIESSIPKEDIEENKKEVYNNILMCLYSYAPAKIYFIENLLLMDAIKENDNDQIVKLSNLMLQGALITANYTDALKLLHNILSRMKNPTLIVDGSINTKFLLLSLVQIEILYNVGKFKECTDTAREILSVLNPDIIEKIKPASFSTNLFVSHILETLRLAAFARLYMLDLNIESFLETVSTALGSELPEKDCILAIRDYLRGESYTTGNIEEASAFSKTIFLILQEFDTHSDDYKNFAQNIYQAKLLSADIHQKEIELFCDLLIAHSYAKLNITQKAEAIYNDVLQNSEKSAIFNMVLLSKYLLAKLRYSENNTEEAILLINDSLALIQKNDNQAQIFYAMFEKLYIEIASEEIIPGFDLETEEKKLIPYKELLRRLI